MNNQQSQSPQQQQISLQDLHNQNQHHFMNPPSDDFLEQMLSSLGPPPPSSWPAAADDEDHSSFAPFELDPLNLASKFRAHQIGPRPTHLMLHHHLLAPLTLDHNDAVDPSPFKSPGSSDGPVQGLFNGFGSGSLPSPNQFHPSQAHQNYAGPSPAINQTPAPSGSSGGAQPRPRVRARRGQATDPHSIAERLRRERIAERMKALQELVPNGNKTDKASMLDEIIDYVKFLQLQVKLKKFKGITKVLSMSRLGGAAAVAPLFADMSSEGGGDCIQTNTNGGGVHRRASSNDGNNNQNGSSNDTMTVTEHQVAKLMEEDMGSAMQYLQGKGLCLMPISLATAISTATCHSRNPLINNANPLMGGGGGSFNGGGGEGPTSPNMSVLTVQSATAGNGVADGTIKDSASVSKP